MLDYELMQAKLSTINWLNVQAKHDKELTARNTHGVVAEWRKHCEYNYDKCIGARLKKLLISGGLQYMNMTTNIQSGDDAKVINVQCRYDAQSTAWVATSPDLPAMVVVAYSWIMLQQGISKYFDAKFGG